MDKERCFWIELVTPLRVTQNSEMSAPTPGKALVLINVDERVRQLFELAKLGKSFDEDDRIGLCKAGLDWPYSYAKWALGWIWHQWLLKTSGDIIRREISIFVERGLEMRERAQSYLKLPHHDLLLLHCALFACDDNQLAKVVSAIGDSSGDKGAKPVDIGGGAVATGEIYAAAWSGFLKHSLLGNSERAREEYHLIWTTKRDPQFIAAPKALPAAWVKKDWKAFVKQQQKDFDRLWATARKHNWSVKSENEHQVMVYTGGYKFGHMWCWSHIGLAIMAQRLGADVITDPLFFPANALTDGYAASHRF